MRFILSLGFLFALSTNIATASELRLSFDLVRSNADASHVIVVNSKGKVLESWRGDMKVGSEFPLKECKLTLEQPILELNKSLKIEQTGKVTGNRLILFLRKGNPTFGEGLTVAGYAAADFDDFEISVAWVENGRTYSLQRVGLTTSGPLGMKSGETEAVMKKTVLELNERIGGLLRVAHADRDQGSRSRLLAEIVKRYRGFAPEAFAGLEWCGPDGLPALRTIVAKDELPGHDESAATYRIMSLIGPTARNELVGLFDRHFKEFQDLSRWVEYSGRLREDLVGPYRNLVAATTNPAAFTGLTAEQKKLLTEFRTFWAGHPVLSKMGEPNDGLQHRLDRILNAAK
jgi:hypothetical protein